MQEVALTGDEFGQDKETKLERDAVALMTLHAAKGLEFREVYMVGMEEGTLPHHRSIAEPKGDRLRLPERPGGCFAQTVPVPFPARWSKRTAVLRRRHPPARLTLTLALNRLKWGKSRPTIPSRFLYELTGRADNPNYLAASKANTNGRKNGTTKK